MTDVAIPRPISARSGRPITAFMLLAVILLLFAILTSINWSAVLAKTEKCKVLPGPFNSGFSQGFDVRREPCFSQSDAMPLGMP
jgi:hypothetical protein